MTFRDLTGRVGRRLAGCMLACSLALQTQWAIAEDGGFTPSINDFGTTGLMQMPNARFHPEGELNIGVSRITPYTRGYFTLQGLPWLEGTFRYTNIGNRNFSEQPAFSGDQSFKDRSVDLKVRLVEESKYLPQVAVQLRDLGGTDLFGSEFLVASRRYYNWDFTFGLAWGNAGSRGHIRNPFSYISKRFKDRGRSQGAGAFGFDFFRGERIALFGGVEYLTPIDGLRLKMEYDGNSYQDEPLGNRFDVNLPVNFGIEYDLFPWMRVAAAFERGTQLLVRANLRTNLNTEKGLTKNDTPPPEVRRRRKKPEPTHVAAHHATVDTKIVRAAVPDRALVINRHNQMLRRFGLDVRSLRIESGIAIVRLSPSGLPPAPDKLADAALRISRDSAGEHIHTVRYEVTDRANRPHLFDIPRADLERSVSLTGSAIAMVEPPPEAWLAHFDARGTSRQATDGEDKDKARQEVERIAGMVFAEVKQQGFDGESFGIDGQKAVLFFSQNKFRVPTKAIGRAARAVARHAPEHIEEISVVITQNGVPISKTTIMRRDLEAALHAEGSPEEMWQNASVTSVLPPKSGETVENASRHPELRWSLSPQTRQQIGGPDDFFFFQLYGRGVAEIEFAPGFTVSGAVGVNIYNNFSGLRLRSDSRLARVRSDIALYLREGKQWIDQLHADYITKLGPEVYARLSAGIFELMFTGVGGEVLYRPVGRRWAIGADLNYVRQRDFDGLIGLQDYDIVTGHLTYYHRLPFYEILASVSVGRYLAGDYGGTVTLSRTFDNGTSFGVFATKTNVSSADFGEGSFDKGFFLNVPLDLFFPTSNRRSTGFTFRPVTRDGGQKLGIPKPLYGVTDGADYDRISNGWDEILK